MKSIIAALVVFIIISAFLLAICKANGNQNDDEEQERYLQDRKKVKK